MQAKIPHIEICAAQHNHVKDLMSWGDFCDVCGRHAKWRNHTSIVSSRVWTRALSVSTNLSKVSRFWNPIGQIFVKWQCITNSGLKRSETSKKRSRHVHKPPAVRRAKFPKTKCRVCQAKVRNPSINLWTAVKLHWFEILNVLTWASHPNHINKYVLCCDANTHWLICMCAIRKMLTNDQHVTAQCH